MAPRSPEPIATRSEELAEQRRQVLAEAAGQEGDAETLPDVLLDVPMLKVDKIGLDVDELRARVSLRSNLGDLINIEVGADVGIGRVSMTLEGVEAQTLLKARLERVFQIFNRALDTVDKHPEVLTSVLRPVGQAAREALEKDGFFEASAGSEASTRPGSDGEDRLVTDAGPVDEEGRSGE